MLLQSSSILKDIRPPQSASSSCALPLLTMLIKLKTAVLQMLTETVPVPETHRASLLIHTYNMNNSCSTNRSVSKWMDHVSSTYLLADPETTISSSIELALTLKA